MYFTHTHTHTRTHTYIYIYWLLAGRSGIESRWGRDFTHLSRPVLGPTQPPVQWVPGLSRGKERPGRDADPSPPSNAVGHERVELYLYSPYEPYGLYKGALYLFFHYVTIAETDSFPFTLSTYTGCFFYRCPEHRSCHGRSRRMQAFYVLQPPCFSDIGLFVSSTTRTRVA